MESHQAETGDLQRWWREHSELDRLVAALERTLGGRRAAEVQDALDDLQESLEAHFNLEERLYFPLVERYSPDHASAVRAAVQGHAAIRLALRELSDLVEAGETSAARRALGLLLDQFRSHEAHEEQLISELEDRERGTNR